jgi:hypothetical protein
MSETASGVRFSDLTIELSSPVFRDFVFRTFVISPFLDSLKLFGRGNDPKRVYWQSVIFPRYFMFARRCLCGSASCFATGSVFLELVF